MQWGNLVARYWWQGDPHMKKWLCFFLSAALGLAFSLATVAQEMDAVKGTIASIDRRGTVTYLQVTLASPSAQPTNPNLSVPKPDASVTTDLSTTKITVVPGMPVKLFITSSGGVFSPTVGVVESVPDATHCIVKVDPASLDETWQDPSDSNHLHKAGEYLKVGAQVSVWGVTSGTIRKSGGL
jgi:hypothetical protein